MKKASRPVLIGVFLLVLLSSSCNLPAQTTAPVGTILPGDQSQSPETTTSSAGTETSSLLTPIIPITGENVVQMQCQFCVNDLTHAVFVFPDFAIFDVETPSPVTCLTAEVVNGKRILVCNGPQNTSFNLKICTDPTNCLLYPVALQPCPLLAAGGTPIPTPAVSRTPVSPVFLTPINTLRPPPTSTPAANATLPSVGPTQTGVFPPPSTPTSGPTDQPTTTPIVPPPATSTSAPPPAPTETLPPPPPPTEPPPATQPPPEPTNSDPGGGKKPTKTPKTQLQGEVMLEEDIFI